MKGNIKNTLFYGLCQYAELRTSMFHNPNYIVKKIEGQEKESKEETEEHKTEEKKDLKDLQK